MWNTFKETMSYNDYDEFKSDDVVVRKRNPYITSISSYKKLENIEDVDAYVVNIQDATNFDIDIVNIPDYMKSKYNEVHKNVYEYIEYDRNLDESRAKKGITYRCHLRDIDMREKKKKNGLSAAAKREVEELIFKHNRWIKCNIGDIDIYNRLLIDVRIPTKDGHTIDLAPHLLMKYGTIYQKYETKEEIGYFNTGC